MASENTSVFPPSISAEAYNKRQVSNKPPVSFKPNTADPDDPKAAYTVSITLDEEGMIKQSVPQHTGGNTEAHLKFLQTMYQLAESKGILPTIKRIHEEVDALEERRTLLEVDVPTGADKDLEVTDDNSIESDVSSSSSSSDSEEDRKKKKKKAAKKITKGALYAKKKTYLQERFKKKRLEEAKSIYELINMVNRCLDTTQSTAYQSITKEVMRIKDWTDEDGNVHPEEMGLTLFSFHRINKEYMLLGCTQDAAEVLKEYLQYGIRLPTGCPLKVFYNRLMQINSYFVLLPCLKDTTLAPEDMPRANKELSNFELTTVILRAVPTAWVNSYKLTHPVIPMDSKKLREDLEVIEKSESSKRKLEEKKESSREKKKKAKDASPKGGNPKDTRNSNGKHCSNCAKHGGPHKTHDTADCFKYNSDGSRKSKPNDNKWGRKRGGDKPKANYAQLQKQIVSLEKKVKKAGKNKRKSSRKERRRKSYDSSDSEDSSESE
jgi:hypothetical protein